MERIRCDLRAVHGTREPPRRGRRRLRHLMFPRFGTAVRYGRCTFLRSSAGAWRSARSHMRAAVVSSRQQLNRLNSVERDRGAADKSTESVRSRDPGQRERGSRRSGERFLCRFLLARRRRSAGLSQFVERYRRVGRPVSVLPVLQIISRKCSTRAFTAFSVSELVGADNEGPTPPPRSQFPFRKEATP